MTFVADHEITFLWKRARSASAYWFFAIRYLGFVGNIPVTVFTFYTMAPKLLYFPEGPFAGVMHITSGISWYSLAHNLLFQVWICDPPRNSADLAAVVMLLRIYALYGRNIRLLVCLLGLSVPLISVIVWSMLGQHSESIVILPGCHSSISRSTVHYSDLGLIVRPTPSFHTLNANKLTDLAAAWEALFVYDALIFGLTVFKTYSTWRRAGSQHYLPIHILILRDGALYFAAMALANLLNIVTFYLSGPILAGSLSTFASCMSVALMSRLMLNLHQKAHVGVLTHLNLSFDDGVVLGTFDPDNNNIPPTAELSTQTHVPP
ncbi:hypothetical protein FB451DRAFT_1390956 [Mycena latifolia]|nr:hypothetical protein FB451DRAFT_1390956 [Mycena latifolia]